MIEKHLYTAHVAHRGGEASINVMASSFAQAGEAVVSLNPQLLPINRETGRGTTTMKIWRDGQDQAAYVPVTKTATGVVIAGMVRYEDQRIDRYPTVREYRIKARGQAELSVWSDSINEAVSEYFSTLMDRTDFNPKFNPDIAVRIWTENLTDPTLIHTWEWRADVEIEVVAHCRGRERAVMRNKEEYVGT